MRSSGEALLGNKKLQSDIIGFNKTTKHVPSKIFYSLLVLFRLLYGYHIRPGHHIPLSNWVPRGKIYLSINIT